MTTSMWSMKNKGRSQDRVVSRVTKITIGISEIRRVKRRRHRNLQHRLSMRLRVLILRRRFQRMINSERIPIRATKDNSDAT